MSAYQEALKTALAGDYYLTWDEIHLVLENATSTRRTKAEITAIEDAIYLTTEELRPMTVRQLFYQLVSRKVIHKTEAEYKQTVVRLLTSMRRRGAIPFDWIADNTRWMRKPRTHSGLSQMLSRSIQTYRRALWDDQSAYVEIWLEKDALAGVLYEVTEEFDVPLMVTRGYPSLSFIASAADTIMHQNKMGKIAYLYYLGDRDPSGVDIPRKVQEDLGEMGCHFTFAVIAVTDDQIAEFDLPTRPTKQTDTRAKNFKGESVEVDAIPPGALKSLVRRHIEMHIDQDVLHRTRMIEEAERESLAAMASGFL